VVVSFCPVTPAVYDADADANGIVTSNQMRAQEVVQRYGDDGNADITTRQNIQLRASGLRMPDIFKRFQTVLTSVQSGMDNNRNITGDPAGLCRRVVRYARTGTSGFKT